jgi:tetratricopeptide (TPR) repeat protein
MVIVLVSCSTKKNTFTRRAYHNLTSHYNAYFNGVEAMKDGQRELAKMAQDNFSKILVPVNYGTKENAQSIGGQMDRAIQKASMVIDRHSMVFKGVEYNNWVDDSYMLIGKANFYKKDFKTALKTFEYVLKRYKDPIIKSEATLWMIKTHILLQEFDRAESLLDEVTNKSKKETQASTFKRDLALAKAEFYIYQENYAPSEEFLIQTLGYHHPKTQKARILFILGQINQRRNNNVQATQYYKKVLNTNPYYELAFNTRINMAKCYDASSGTGKEIVKSLNKMLKDPKNKEYLDQIYFALAEIYEKDGDSLGAKDYLKKCVAEGGKNKYLRGVASLKVANIFYRETEYVASQAYYDTAVQNLPPEYPDLTSVKMRVNVLTELVRNINIVDTEDSLQRIARLSDADRMKYINELIEKLKRDEEKKKQEMTQMSGANPLQYRMGNRVDASGNIQSSGGGWYFYNTSQVSMGFSDFERKWGKRKLEDNWRLTYKEPVLEFEEEVVETEDTLAVDSLRTITNDPKDPKTYLQRLPLTEAQMARSENKIKEALFTLGTIYYQGLSDYGKSEESLESLLKRYPADTTYYLRSCFTLYEMYREIGESSKSNHYKDLILKRFPDSDFARIIRDPAYAVELAKKKNEVNELYQTTYKAYLNKQFPTVLDNCAKAKKMTTDKNLLNRFEFLRVVARGKTQNNDSLLVGLKGYVNRSSSPELKLLAQQMIESLENKNPQNASTATDNTAGTASRSYTTNDNAIHLFVMVADMKKVNTTAAKLKISDYNQKYNSLEKLSTTSIYLDDKFQIITVSNFPDKEKAMDYYNGIVKSEYVFATLQKDGFQVFVISVDNYPILYKTKDLKNYTEFFKDNYL